jgi:hypothetical protein
MKINNPDYRNGPVFFKFITVKGLMELLAQVPEDYLVNAQSMARTGNLGIYSRADLDAPLEYIINIGDEELTFYGDLSNNFKDLNNHKP